MEKQSSISSSKFIGATLENIIINSDISLSKIKEVQDSLDKASKAIILPILKIQKKLESSFTSLENSNEKQETDNQALFSFSNVPNNITTNSMFSIYENINQNLDIFNKLLKSNEYENLIKGFDKIIPDNEIFMPIEKEEDLEKKKEEKERKEKEEKEKKEKEEKEKKDKKEKKEKKEKDENKKKDKEDNKDNKENKKEKTSSKNNTKSKKGKKNTKKGNKKTNKKNAKDSKKNPHQQNGVPIRKKQRKEMDLLELLQSEYSSNSYVQKISKTFLSRRLFKNVIYRHIFDYKENHTIDENKLRSSGESTVYKYAKFIFKFLNNVININEIQEVTGKLNEFVGKELKQQFVKFDEEKKEYIIAGKIGSSLGEIIEKVFKEDLFKEFRINRATLEFYEFYEELVNEFDENEKNVKIVFCDEKLLKHLREDWKNLEMVRNFVIKVKKEQQQKAIAKSKENKEKKMNKEKGEKKEIQKENNINMIFNSESNINQEINNMNFNNSNNIDSNINNIMRYFIYNNNYNYLIKNDEIEKERDREKERERKEKEKQIDMVLESITKK